MSEEPQPLKIEIIDKMAELITTAFGLVAALAWNDAIKAIFKETFGASDAVVLMLAYAITVTIIAVTLIIIVARRFANAKAKN